MAYGKSNSTVHAAQGVLLVFLTVICPWNPLPQSCVTAKLAEPEPDVTGGGGGRGGATTVAVPAAWANVAPTGFARSSWNDSLVVGDRSGTTWTVTVFDVWPAANVSVPLVAV